MPHTPADDPREPVSRPASSREIFSPTFGVEPGRVESGDDESSDSVSSTSRRPTLALPKKRPLILWIGIALLLGGLVALIFVGFAAD